jgi:hypothetical protein
MPVRNTVKTQPEHKFSSDSKAASLHFTLPLCHNFPNVRALSIVAGSTINARAGRYCFTAPKVSSKNFLTEEALIQHSAA